MSSEEKSSSSLLCDTKYVMKRTKIIRSALQYENRHNWCCQCWWNGHAVPCSGQRSPLSFTYIRQCWPILWLRAYTIKTKRMRRLIENWNKPVICTGKKVPCCFSPCFNFRMNYDDATVIVMEIFRHERSDGRSTPQARLRSVVYVCEIR